MLDPIYQIHKYIIASICGQDRLPKCPRPVTAVAVSHARDAEETIKLIQFRVAGVHGLGYMVIITHGLLTCDYGVRAAVVSDYLAAIRAKGRQIARIRGHVAVGDVGCVGVGYGEGGEGRGVPGGIVVDDVLVPLLLGVS